MHCIWNLEVGKELKRDIAKAGEWETKKIRGCSAL